MAALALACILSTLSQASAVMLSIGDSLGLIDKNQPADPASTTNFLNILLDLTPGTATTSGTNTITRSLNNPAGGVYPDAVYSGQFGSGVTSIDLGGGHLYLLAKYDGQNYGSVVWYVGGLTGTISIPGFALSNPDKYGVSHTYLFNPNGTSVPDGGSTTMLLGLSLCALGFASRLIGRKALSR
jgi:VPDSG-CTERM motif